MLMAGILGVMLMVGVLGVMHAWCDCLYAHVILKSSYNW